VDDVTVQLIKMTNIHTSQMWARWLTVYSSCCEATVHEQRLAACLKLVSLLLLLLLFLLP
jgi:hypothetical protein